MPAIENLEIIDLRDPNTMEERVLLRAKDSAKLDDYLIVNTKLNESDKLNTLNEHVFWFPAGVTAKAGDLIRVYTRKEGKYSTQMSTYGEEKVMYHDFYWGLSKSVWDIINSDTVTVLHANGWTSLTKKKLD